MGMQLYSFEKIIKINWWINCVTVIATDHTSTDEFKTKNNFR